MGLPFAALTSSITNALYLGETVPTLLENGSEAVDWWALHTGLQDGAGVGDLGLLSSGRQDCLPRTSCAPPVNTPFPAYYGMQPTSALTVPGSRLVGVTSGDAVSVRSWGPGRSAFSAIAGQRGLGV